MDWTSIIIALIKVGLVVAISLFLLYPINKEPRTKNYNIDGVD